MPTIEVSQVDYELLMSLSKEIQTQPNDGNATPAFWTARSEHDVPNVIDEGTPTIYHDGEQCSFKEFFEYHSDSETEFFQDYLDDVDHESYDEEKWSDFCETHKDGYHDDCEYSIFWKKPEMKRELNFSIFKSDIQNFISGNKHHLGRKPHIYADTFFRMGKMEQLIYALCRLNPQPKDEVDYQLLRHVYPEVK